ncbi:MAG: DNA/RNA non-specific endonuclease [Bacteroidota bacterium]
MKKLMRLLSTAFLAGLLTLQGCRKDIPAPIQTATQEQKAVYTGFPETMEAGTKTSYTIGNVTLSTGSWSFNNALIGTLSTDRKIGSKSARIQNTGSLTMNFNLGSGASQVSISHGVFGTDASSTWELWASVNSGSTWTKIGNTVTTSSTTLATASFSMSLSGTVRFQIRKLGGGRLNIDNISISDYVVSTFPDNDNYLTMGNPSGAVTNVNQANNYLLVKTEYAMSYNNSRGSCNWVSWRVGNTDLGNVPRCDCFTLDTQLPSTFYRASSTSYTGTGFDRGHQCPSADRNASSTANAATFLMSNMLPQAPNLNQITWENLETYCRTLVSAGNELYIVCGGYGQGGSGSNGGTTSVIAGGSITVPSRCWKVIVVLPNGSNDVSRVSTSTRVIAVDMPNNQSVNSLSWGSYRTTVDAIETATGYNLLPNLPASIQNTLEAAVDNGPTQ